MFTSLYIYYNIHPSHLVTLPLLITNQAACFAKTEQVTLESGHTKAISKVQVGDRILTVNAQGEQVFSDVVYVPHGRNEQRAAFSQVVIKYMT